MRKDLLSKTLVLGVICLFVGVGFQPAFAVDIPEKEDTEPKDYLFETIVAIANNPDVQVLLEEYGHNIINVDFKNNYVFRQLLFKNPELLFSMVFSKPKMTTQYFDKIYNEGIELVDIFGEEKVLGMIESVEFTDTEFLDDFSNFIMNNEELSNRISTLITMNEQLKPDKPFGDTPIICAILIIITVAVFIPAVIMLAIYELIKDFPLLVTIFYYIYYTYFPLMVYFLILTIEVCSDIW